MIMKGDFEFLIEKLSKNSELEVQNAIFWCTENKLFKAYKKRTKVKAINYY